MKTHLSQGEGSLRSEGILKSSKSSFKSAEPSVFRDSEEKPWPRMVETSDSCVQRVVTFKVQLMSPSASCDE